MIRVMLVDDNPLFCAQLRGMLRWEEEGMMIETEARNGREAINSLERNCPDLVLTDISMPIMDGIGLIEYIHRYHPSLPVIALSAYDDFDFVRPSLKLGAQDYLLKHELTPKHLLKIIKNVIASMPADATKDHRSRRQEVEEFFVLLLTGWFDDEDKLKRRANDLEITLPDMGFFPVTVGIDTDEKGEGIFDEPLRELLRETLNGVANEMVPITAKRLMLLEIAASGTRHMEAQRERLQMASATIKRFFGFSLSFGVGEWCDSLTKLPSQYKLACERYNAMRFLGRRSFAIDQDSGEVKTVFSIALDDQRRLTEQLSHGDEEAVGASLDALFLMARERTQCMADVTIMFAELVHILSQASQRTGLEINMEDVPTLSSFSSMDDLQRWCKQSFISLIRIRGQRRMDGCGVYTSAAIDYMHRNYDKHISLKEIAAILNVNASYLSRLFKLETGQNLVAYLNALRMDEAQRLLEDAQLPIKEIAEHVGIANYNHFFALFKEKTGITPVEYRKSLKQ